MPEVSTRATGWPLVVGGVLFILSFGIELIVSPEHDGAVTNLPLYATLNALMAVGVVLIALGLWRLRTLVGARGGRLARAGIWTAIVANFSFLGMNIIAVVVAAQTGRPPDVFALTGLGLLLSFVGPLLLGIGLVRARMTGGWRFLPFMVTIGAALAFVPTDPFHDIGLALLGLGWAIMGGWLWAGANTGAADSVASNA